MSAQPAPTDAPAPNITSIAPQLRKHHDFVWRTLLRFGLPGPLIYEAVEEVFVLSAGHIERDDREGSIRAWLFAFARRVAKRQRRNYERRSRAAPPPSADEEVFRRGPAAERLHGLLDRLDDESRSIFILAELEDMAHTEVAEFVQLEASIIRLRLRALRSELERVADRQTKQELAARE